MDKNSKIYVSGDGGMVGKTMVNLLIKEGYLNIVVKSSSELDLMRQSEVEDFFERERPEYVFHFAARVGGIMKNIENPAGFLYDNLLISSNVINSAYKYGVKKLLNLGSSCVYPRECPQPMKEEYLLSGKLEPSNEGYALAKIAALKLCEYYNKAYGTDFISLMPCNVYGENERFDEKDSHVIAGLIMKFHRAKIEGRPEITLWGSGTARREFLYVSDLARACLYFMLNYGAKDLGVAMDKELASSLVCFGNDPCWGLFINIGSGEDVSILELAEMIKTVVGFDGEIKWDTTKPDGMPRKLLDVSKMKNLNFKPLINLPEGLRSSYQYYLKIIS